MINRYSSTLKTLTPAQRAKARKLIAQYEAERDPIMWQKNKVEQEIRQQAYTDLNSLKRIEEIENEFIPQIEELTKKINELCDARSWLQDEKRKAIEDIRVEPYLIAGNHPKVEILREMWKEVDSRYEAKLADLLESFKESEVA